MWWRPLTMVAVIVLTAVSVRVEPVTIVVESGYYLFEPAWIRVRVRVEPDPENRALSVAILSDSSETSSLEQLPGDKARATRWVTYKDVPAGDYEAIAYVDRGAHAPWMTRSHFMVLSR